MFLRHFVIHFLSIWIVIYMYHYNLWKKKQMYFYVCAFFIPYYIVVGIDSGNVSFFYFKHKILKCTLCTCHVFWHYINLINILVSFDLTFSKIKKCIIDWRYIIIILSIIKIKIHNININYTRIFHIFNITFKLLCCK